MLTLALAIVTLFATARQSQSYPVIGMPMPKFRFDAVQHYDKKSFNNEDLKGKWTIMDFWTKYCSACVQAFPKIDQFQRKFKDDVKFLLVARSDDKLYSNTPQVFDKYKKKLDLNLSIAYDDGTIFNQFGVHGVPHIIVIDPQGVVYAVTDSYFLTEDNLKNLISGKQPVFRKKYSSFETVPASAYHEPWRYLIDEKQSGDFLYRSILSKNTGEPDAGFWNIDYNVQQGFYQRARATLLQLYNIAYLGESEWNRWAAVYKSQWAYPVLEIRDSSNFQFNHLRDEGLYNYSLAVPQEKASKAFLMELMQHDLKNSFGYEVATETRLMPCWKLTANDKAIANLKSKSPITEERRDPSGITAKRIPIGLVIAQIEEYNMNERIPFFDETNILGPIDISYTAAMTEITDVQKELRKLGLTLEKSKKQMKVLVIRDSKPIGGAQLSVGSAKM